MKNKKIFAGIMALMLLASMSSVLAEDVLIASNNESSENFDLSSEELAEIDSELNENVTSWDINRERIRNWFTFDQEKKAKRELKISQMLLTQARVHAKSNNIQAMENCIESHNKILSRVQERIKKINGESDEEGLRENAEKQVGLERAIEVHKIRIERLQKILSEENLTEHQQIAIETQIERAQTNIELLSEVQQEQQERVKTKLQAVTGMTGNEVDSEFEDMRENARERNRMANRGRK